MLSLQVSLKKTKWAVGPPGLFLCKSTEKGGGKSLPTVYWSRDKKNKVLNEAETIGSLLILWES